jgi:hypothetical protein
VVGGGKRSTKEESEKEKFEIAIRSGNEDS